MAQNSCLGFSLRLRNFCNFIHFKPASGYSFAVDPVNLREFALSLGGSACPDYSFTVSRFALSGIGQSVGFSSVLSIVRR